VRGGQFIAHLADCQRLIYNKTMDKKIKKKIDTLHQRIKNLQQQIAGTKKQLDDPADLKNLEKQLAAAEAELAKIK
jgi:DNA-binding FrmR family transcriptional regulator